MKTSRRLIYPFISILFLSQLCEAQTSGLVKLLSDVEYSYPSLKIAQLRVQASEKEVGIAKNTAMPSLDAAIQTNLSTHNNISGMVNQQYMFPISGPPSAGNDSQPVWGNAASLLLSWQPYTFGKRNALINQAKSLMEVQQAELDNAVFQFKIQIAQVYLEWLMTYEAEKVLIKNVERARHNAIQSRTLALAGIRPGSDSALFISELSNANVQLLQMQRLRKDQIIKLEILLDTTFSSALYDSSFFMEKPNFSKSVNAQANPAIVISQRQIDFASARKTSVQRSMYPRLSLWGTTFARGSDINYDGSITSKGFSFSRYNYGLGVQLAIPILKFTDVRLQLKQQQLLLLAREQKLAQTKLELNRDLLLAENSLQTAVQITDETTLQYQSAEFAYNAIQSRYNSGIIDFTTLVQAQYNLVKAEIELKKSYLEMWRALLSKSAASGDLSIFINELR